MEFAQELSMAIGAICPECGHGEDSVVRLVKKHDTEPLFFETVYKLNVRQKWDLLQCLWGADYNIFKPWYYKTLMEVIKDTSNDNGTAEQRINKRAVDLYDYYKDAFEASKEEEQPLSNEWLEMWHRSAVSEAADKIEEMIEDGVIDPETLEILPEYKNAVRKRQK